MHTFRMEVSDALLEELILERRGQEKVPAAHRQGAGSTAGTGTLGKWGSAPLAGRSPCSQSRGRGQARGRWGQAGRTWMWLHRSRNPLAVCTGAVRSDLHF